MTRELLSRKIWRKIYNGGELGATMAEVRKIGRDASPEIFRRAMSDLLDRGAVIYAMQIGCPLAPDRGLAEAAKGIRFYALASGPEMTVEKKG